MRLRLLMMPVFLLAALLPGVVAAQTQVASPSASPVAAPSGWRVAETRDIDVDGQPVALSPDGRWIAGTGLNDSGICIWEIDTLTPTCAEVGAPVIPWIGNSALRWAPDSSAFAFVEGDMARLTIGDVFVFFVETGELVNLTNTGGAMENGPIYLGADWTPDSQQVVFGINHGLGDTVKPDDVVRVDRAGGEPVSVPLPAWSDVYDILFPPLVGGGAVYVPIDADTNIAGIWRVALDGAEPQQVVMESGDQPVDFPMPVSGTPDGRYVNVVSVTGLQLLLLDETFFLLDTEPGELIPLVSDDSLGMIAFAPDSDVGLMVQERDGEDRLSTIDAATGEIAPVANSPEVDTWLMTIPIWAENDTVFLPADGGGTLITLVPEV